MNYRAILKCVTGAFIFVFIAGMDGCNEPGSLLLPPPATPAASLGRVEPYAVLNADGTGMVVYKDSVASLSGVPYSPNLTFGTPESIVARSGAGRYIYHDVAHNTQGDIMVAWRDRLSCPASQVSDETPFGNSDCGVAESISVRRKLSGSASWEAPIEITPGGLAASGIDANARVFVGLSDTGLALIVWAKADAIFASVLPNLATTAGVPMLVASGLSDIDSPSAPGHIAVEMATNGETIIAYAREDGIYARTFSIGNLLGPEELVAAPHAAFSLAVNPASVVSQTVVGAILVTDNATGNVWLPGMGWGGENLLPLAGTGFTDKFEVGLDAFGNGLLVWHQHAPAVVRTMPFRNQAWVTGRAEDLGNISTRTETNSAVCGRPSLSVAPAGDGLLLVCRRSAPKLFTVSSWTFANTGFDQQAPSSGWGGEQPIDTLDTSTTLKADSIFVRHGDRSLSTAIVTSSTALAAWDAIDLSPGGVGIRLDANVRAFEWRGLAAIFSFTRNFFTVDFDASASTPGAQGDPIIQYSWDFENDGSIDVIGGPVAGLSATHTYPAAGDYDVWMEVTDQQSQKAETVRTVTVVDAAAITTETYNGTLMQAVGDSGDNTKFLNIPGGSITYALDVTIDVPARTITITAPGLFVDVVGTWYPVTNTFDDANAIDDSQLSFTVEANGLIIDNNGQKQLQMNYITRDKTDTNQLARYTYDGTSP